MTVFFDKAIANAIKTQEQQASLNNNGTKDEVEEAINILNSITDYKSEEVFIKKVLYAASLCKLKAPINFDSFKRGCKINKIDMSTFNDSVNIIYSSLQFLKK